MTGERRDVLNRIAGANVHPASGPGANDKQFVPAFRISNRAVARMLAQRLGECDIRVKRRHERLAVQFFVAATDLRQALEIRDEFLRTQPDSQPRGFTRDYDSLFIVLPITALATITAFFAPLPGRQYVWVAILVSGISLAMVLERIHRQDRYQLGTQWGVRELLWVTGIAAVNLAVWRAVL